MRISHEKKFIFLAVPRTGSTSLRDLLDPYSDIKSVHITETNRNHPYYHHISARELKDIFDKNGWDFSSYSKFCVVRNPFDRVVSLYHHYLKHRREGSFLRRAYHKVTPPPDFASYVQKIDPESRLTTTIRAFTCDSSGAALVDKVLKFEELSTELPVYLQELGIPADKATLPHLNSSANRKVSYRDYYNDTLRAHVAKLYREDIERFGYSF
ncbi:sulfotransferase family 2 domain-containing protein [Pseudoroseicyclus sp. H15]